MTINIKKSVISLSNTYELYLNRLTIKDHEDREYIVIQDKDLEDLKEFLNST